jgi:ATP-dependent Zn protease
VSGKDGKVHRLSEHERIGTAYHEAGHVVVGIIFGRVPQSSTILPDGKGRLGETKFDETPDYMKGGPNRWDDLGYRHYVQGRVVGQLAGTAAHDLDEPGRAHDTGDTKDENDAKELIEYQVPHELRSGYLEQSKQMATDLLRRHWHAVEVVAQALLDQSTLDRAALLELCEPFSLRANSESLG